jgi:hypothetical protein
MLEALRLDRRYGQILKFMFFEHYEYDERKDDSVLCFLKVHFRLLVEVYRCAYVMKRYEGLFLYTEWIITRRNHF